MGKCNKGTHTWGEKNRQRWEKRQRNERQGEQTPKMRETKKQRDEKSLFNAQQWHNRPLFSLFSRLIKNLWLRKITENITKAQTQILKIKRRRLETVTLTSTGNMKYIRRYQIKEQKWVSWCVCVWISRPKWCLCHTRVPWQHPCVFSCTSDWACVWVKHWGHGGRDRMLEARCAGRRCLHLWVITRVSEWNEPTAFHIRTPCLLLSDTSVIDGRNFPPASWFDHTAMGPI